MVKINSVEEVFLLKLRALYDVEEVLVKALPKMIKVAKDTELKVGLTDHLNETKNHLVRLEEAFTILETKPSKLKSEGIRGIVEDGEWVMKQIMPTPLMDSMVASSGRYAEHYEMSGYMSAIELSKILEEDQITNLLVQTLEEEKKADALLAEVMTRNSSSL